MMFKKLLAIALVTLLAVSMRPMHQILADTTPANLISNPSAETAQSSTMPAEWQASGWSETTNGNDASFSYLNTGHTGNHSLRADITSYTDGAANWNPAALIPVTPQTLYQYSDWYQSNVSTEGGAEFYDANKNKIAGAAGYAWLGTIDPSEDWKQFSTTITTPDGAAYMNVFHLLAKVGYLVTDDYSLTKYVPTGFNRAMVSVTFDDGWKSQVSAANLKAMSDNGIAGTYYIITDASIDNPDPEYMNANDVLALQAAGYEIGSHTVHHCDLTGVYTDNATSCPTPISPAQVTTELVNSQQTLQNLIGKPVTDFAYPYGNNNDATAAEGMKYYRSMRTVDPGYNSADNFNPAKLKMYEIDKGTTVAQVKQWVNDAISQKLWLILTYHQIINNKNEVYNALPADFAAEMAYINSKQAEIASLTVAQALAEVQTQLAPTPTPTPTSTPTPTVTPTPTPTPTSTPIPTPTPTPSPTVTPTPSPTPTPTPATKPGDLNGDNTVDALDLSILLTNWNKIGVATTKGDINHDGTVDALDLSTLLTNWSK